MCGLNYVGVNDEESTQCQHSMVDRDCHALLTLNSRQGNLHTLNLLHDVQYNVWPELCTVGGNAKVSTKFQYSVVH